MCLEPDGRSLRSGLFSGRALLIGVACVAALGCGNKRPPTVPVSGKVTIDGKAPPAGGTVWFTPDEAAAGFAMRPGTGDFGADGAFQAKTFVPGDGLLPGHYRVRIDCWKVAPNMEGKRTQSYLPAKYQNPQESGLELTVKPDDDPLTFNVEIPASKKK